MLPPGEPRLGSSSTSGSLSQAAVRLTDWLANRPTQPSAGGDDRMGGPPTPAGGSVTAAIKLHCRRVRRSPSQFGEHWPQPLGKGLCVGRVGRSAADTTNLVALYFGALRIAELGAA